eukprot:CAMPEP_0198283952 /NCGR_PEP_ID=MMETSP1449-20131203/3532_1 /TAXON_ID=420275 /ORGANISM="Attheya septentrionalis, Strain CCMP2084" /LENGTH=513 /DNA_ID=CAMNT_0043980857 /DNA_START=181 /DNA_END=1722 /DNA_ORIENTATION=+
MEYQDIHHKKQVLGISLALISVCVMLMVFRDSTAVSLIPHDILLSRRLDVYTPDTQELMLFPLRTWDYIGFFCATAGLVLAAGGGIGGGGILVPVYILLLRFPVKHAVSLSNVTIFGGGVANILLNSMKRHPLADRPLIDWDLMLVMEPLTMAGALIGADLNEMLPDVIIVVLLVILLTFIANKTLKKARDMYAKESHHFKMIELDTTGHDPDDETPIFADSKQLPINSSLPIESSKNNYGALSDMNGNLEVETTTDDSTDDGSSIKPHLALAKILKREKSTNLHNLIILVELCVTVITINVMKGGGAFESPLGIECGSWSFYAAEAIMLGIILSISLYARCYLLRQTKEKQLAKYEYVEGDLMWDSRSTLIYPSICACAGLAAGLFGIGGGIIKGPLMLAMGVHPSVVSATSACMILFTSFTATTSFMVFGELNYQYATVCLVLGFMATLLGQIVMALLIKKYNRISYIAFTIGFVVAISAVFMTLESVIAIQEGNPKNGAGMCPVSMDKNA